MNEHDLRMLGFVEAGMCSFDPGLKSGVRFSVTRSHGERVIYAFVVDEAAKYVGVCDNTKTCFASRMSRYQGMTCNGTNKRIAERVKRVLSQGSTVKIFVWRPEQQVRVGDLTIDLIKGIENPLISRIHPEWNIHG
jgi:hypothetical protein